jgi:hypothetical protein
VKKLKGWKEKNLFFASRGTLIKVVAQAIPTYLMSNFNPKRVVKLYGEYDQQVLVGQQCGPKEETTLGKLEENLQAKKSRWDGFRRSQSLQ